MSGSARPHRHQPTRLPHPWDSPGKNTGVGCHFLLQCVKVKSESEVAHSCPTFSNPMDRSHQAPSSTGFSRQEYWSGVPLPSPLHFLVVTFKNIFNITGTPRSVLFFISLCRYCVYFVLHVEGLWQHYITR